MLREGFFVCLLFFLSFLIVSLCCHVLLFLFYGSVATKAGRTKQVTFPGISSGGGSLLCKISKRVKKEIYILL
uniref:Uncharacterized protein n=1 Tax=Ixodes scapularis TaxID=6945 RepID=A0A4D5RW56_IXOSC